MVIIIVVFILWSMVGAVCSAITLTSTPDRPKGWTKNVPDWKCSTFMFIGGPLMWTIYFMLFLLFTDEQETEHE